MRINKGVLKRFNKNLNLSGKEVVVTSKQLFKDPIKKLNAENSNQLLNKILGSKFISKSIKLSIEHSSCQIMSCIIFR